MKPSLVKARAVLAAKNAERQARPEYRLQRRAVKAVAQKRWYTTRPPAQRKEINAKKKLAKASRLYVRMAVLGLSPPRLAPKTVKPSPPRRKIFTETERALSRRLKNQRKNARRKGAAGRIKASDIESLRTLQRGRCFYCHEKFGAAGFHIDHYTALARGGSNYSDNLRLACPTCNIAKSDQPGDQFRNAARLMVCF